jgi:hypothetical protein
MVRQEAQYGLLTLPPHIYSFQQKSRCLPRESTRGAGARLIPPPLWCSPLAGGSRTPLPLLNPYGTPPTLPPASSTSSPSLPLAAASLRPQGLHQLLSPSPTPAGGNFSDYIEDEHQSMACCTQDSRDNVGIFFDFRFVCLIVWRQVGFSVCVRVMYDHVIEWNSTCIVLKNIIHKDLKSRIWGNIVVQYWFCALLQVLFF